MQNPTPARTARPRRRLLLTLVGLIAFGVVVALVTPGLLGLWRDTKAKDDAMRYFTSREGNDMGGFWLDSTGKASSTGLGFSGEVLAGPDSHLLPRLADLTSPGSSDDFDPALLWSRAGERRNDCPGASVAAQVRLKRIDEILTFSGCDTPANTAGLKVWRGDRELDTSFTTWFSREGLEFVRGFAIDGAATDRLYELDITAHRISMALVDPGRPEACVVTRWTWSLDDLGLSLDEVACEAAMKGPYQSEPMTVDDFSPYPSIGDWDPGETLDRLTAALADAGASEARQASLRLAGPDGRTPALAVNGGGRDVIVALTAADQPLLSADPPSPALLGLPWPATVDQWRLTSKPGDAGEVKATYLLGGRSVTAEAIPPRPFPRDWFEWTASDIPMPVTSGEAVCGLASRLTSGALCLARIEDGTLLVTAESAEDLAPVAQLTDALAKAGKR